MINPTDGSSDDSSSVTPPLGGAGGVRGDAFPVEAVVTFNNNPITGVSVAFASTDSVIATTDEEGVASIDLPAGTYLVTASTAAATATASIDVVPSTDPLIVMLSLIAG